MRSDKESIKSTSKEVYDHAVGEVTEITSSFDPEKNQESLDNGDMILKLANAHDRITYTPEEESKLQRKLDIYVTTLMCVIYGTQFMDKVTISFAGIMGIRQDLHLKGTEFSWLTTGFYFGFLFFEFPSVRLLSRFPLIRTMSILIFCWGAVQILNAATFNFASMLAARFFLGVFESSLSPSMTKLTATFFPAKSHFTRSTFWWSSNGFGHIIGAIIAYALAKHQDSMELEAWKVLFLVTGCFTISLSAILYFHLSDTPATAWFLTVRERQIAVERMRDGHQGFGNKKFKKYQAIEAFKDPRTYMYFIHGVISTVPNGSLTSFGSILLKDSLGFSELNALLLAMPNGACQFFSSFVIFFAIKYFGHRTIVGMLCYSVAFLGCCLLAFAKSKTAQLIGYFLSAIIHTGWVTMISSVTSNSLGTTKKSIVTGLYFVSYCVGNMIGPQTFKAKWAPDYGPSKAIMAACSAASLSMMLVVYLYNMRENKKRDREAEKLGDAYYNPPENYEFMDLTDFENKNFRYII